MIAGKYSLYFASGTNLLLLLTWYGGIGGVLFDDRQKDIGMDVPVNLFLFLEALLPYILCCTGIDIIFELVVCWMYSQKLFIFVFDVTNRPISFKNKIK